MAALVVLGLPVANVQGATTGSEQTYLLVYKAGASSATAPSLVQGAGGTLVYNYAKIGVAVVRSSRSDFTSKALKDTSVGAVARSTAGVTRLRDTQPDAGNAGVDQQGEFDSLTKFQWDMRQIHAFEAQDITAGSRSVVVGDIDTGADFTHPDLSPNIDFSKSVSCIGGSPNQSPAAWSDDNGHGTHTAGTIAGVGFNNGTLGVAPHVKLAIIKSGDQAGFFFPETVVCSFMWAGSHNINVTNNSYFADPFYWNCPSDPEQGAILTAETRAIQFAENNGVLNVAAAGNFSDDLAHPTQDRQSPDNTTPITRPVDSSCIIVPTEVSGVFTVSSVGAFKLKSYFSNYGTGVIQVTAPGGDRRYQVDPAHGVENGRVLSTYPLNRTDCANPRFDGTATYCYLQGTSMASPHVAGLAALIESTGIRDPEAVKIRIIQTADALACPTPAQLLIVRYDLFPSVNNRAPQVCAGTAALNNFYGHGLVNALAAVSPFAGAQS